MQLSPATAAPAPAQPVTPERRALAQNIVMGALEPFIEPMSKFAELEFSGVKQATPAELFAGVAPDAMRASLAPHLAAVKDVMPQAEGKANAVAQALDGVRELLAKAVTDTATVLPISAAGTEFDAYTKAIIAPVDKPLTELLQALDPSIDLQSLAG